MKKLFYLSLLVFYHCLSAQSNTEVYLVDFEKLKGNNKLVTLKDISNNEGYDNQPSFYDENTLLFASTRDQQTDIARYDIEEEKLSWITNSKVGSEYSPLKIPNQQAISAIRLDTTGLQRLYEIDFQKGTAKELLKDLVVGYHVWYGENILVCTVLAGEQMDLVVANLKEKTNHTVARNVGRSLHKIPNSDLISFISQEGESWNLKSLNPKTRLTKEMVQLPEKTNDMCWLKDGKILLPQANRILSLDPTTDKNWNVFYEFDNAEINEISRMLVSPDGKYLSFVSEKSPTVIIDKQVESFNNADLETFAACFSKEVLVENFPTDTMYVGNEQLKSNYKRFFAQNPNSKVEVVNRIVLGNNVIDEEKVIVKGKKYHQAALYKVKNGEITSMTFISSQEDSLNVEKIVQEQLDAYNNRNLEEFVLVFSDTLKAYNYPDQLLFEGKEKLQEIFSKWFDETPDLHCDLKNRMVVGNLVIDQEYVTANGDNFSAVAIYQVGNEKIVTMTFVR